MSDLQIGLLGIGIAVIAIVLAYNKWQEVQFKRRAEREFRSRHSDVLFGENPERVQDERSGSGVPLRERIEPALSEGTALPVLDHVDNLASSQANHLAVDGLTEKIDFVLDVSTEAPVQGKSVIDAAVQYLSSSAKSVRIEGVPEGEGDVAWRAVDHDSRYSRIRFGMQLVDRRGRATRADLESFADSVSRVAISVGGAQGTNDLEAVIERANGLDAFCGEVDIQVAVHIAGARFAGTKIRALSEAAGFVLENDGRFRLRDEEGRVLFELANDEATPFSADSLRTLASSSISLELDVPRAPGGKAAFRRFQELAGQLATALGGEIVDDRRIRLTEASFSSIEKQLSAVRETMDSYGIPAGGPLALRLFS